jgi:hypothetical protein
VTDYHFFRLSVTLSSTFSFIWKWLKNFTLPQNNNLKKLSFIIVYLKRKENWFDTFLTQDNASSLASRVKKTDAREIESFYQQYYEHYIRALDQGEQADRYSNDFYASALFFSSFVPFFFFVSFLVVSHCMFDHLDVQICLLNPNS